MVTLENKWLVSIVLGKPCYGFGGLKPEIMGFPLHFRPMCYRGAGGLNLSNKGCRYVQRLVHLRVLKTKGNTVL